MLGRMPSCRARIRPPVAPALALATVLGVGALVGCGGDAVSITGRTLRVRLEEYRLIPQDVRVRAGRLRIVAFNAGRLTHNVRIVRVDPNDAEAPVIGVSGTPTAQPGDTVSATIRDLKPGRYRIICSVANHDKLGMYGSLVATR